MGGGSLRIINGLPQGRGMLCGLPTKFSHDHASQYLEVRIMTKAAARNSPEVRHIAGLGALLALTFGLAGCGSLSEQTAATAFVAPGGYNIYNCKEIDTRIRGARTRLTELEQLMARTEQGVGGAFVSAIAYQSEYAQLRGQIKVMSDTAADKNCNSQSPWSSERSMF